MSLVLPLKVEVDPELLSELGEDWSRPVLIRFVNVARGVRELEVRRLTAETEE
jgi:hypothetical protein